MRRRLPRISAIAVVALTLAACAGQGAPKVTETVALDDKGRQVTTYRICEERGFLFSRLFNRERTCRTERVTRNYCYRSLAGIDCYAEPLPGRAAPSGP